MKKVLLVVVAVAMFAPQAQAAITWREVKEAAKKKGMSLTEYVKAHKKELAAAGLAVAAVAVGGAVAYNQSQKSKQAPMTEAQAGAALVQTAAIVEERPAQAAVIEKENVVPVVQEDSLANKLKESRSKLEKKGESLDEIDRKRSQQNMLSAEAGDLSEKNVTSVKQQIKPAFDELNRQGGGSLNLKVDSEEAAQIAREALAQLEDERAAADNDISDIEVEEDRGY